MSFNSSDKELTDESKIEIFRHSIYLCQGFSIVLFNILIIATIVRHSALRFMKEYTILGAQALADALYGLGSLLAGIYRIPLWLSHQDMLPASPRLCLLTAHNFLWSWFIPAQYLMLSTVSIDRVLSLAIPLTYLTFTRRYALAMVSVPYSLALTGSAAIYVINWPKIEPNYTKICWTSSAYGRTASEIINYVINIASFSSVLIYMAVPILYKKHTAQISNGSLTNNNNNKLQRQLNKTVAVTSVFTFVFVCLPIVVGSVAFVIFPKQKDVELISVWMAILGNVNPMVNLFAYIRKQTYFKVGFKALFKNKTLPPNINNWPTE